MKGLYSADQLASMSLFTRLSRVDPLDCFKNEGTGFTFIVPEGKAGLAVGKAGLNIQKLQRATNKRIKIIEYNPDPCQFVSNIILPLKARKIEKSDSCIRIHSPDIQSKARLIGRDKRNLLALREIFNQYFKEHIEIV